MGMHLPQGPRDSGDPFRDLADLWSFFTRTPIGIAIAIAAILFLIFNSALFATPRLALYLAQVKEPQEDEDASDPDRNSSCQAVVVEAKETCLGDPKLPAPDGDISPSMEDAARPATVFFANDSVDGYFESYFPLNVKVWAWAAEQTQDDAERARRRCITQVITDRYGSKNTFAAYSGDASERNAIGTQTGWFPTQIVRLKAPDYSFSIGSLAFEPLRASSVKASCGDELAQ